MSEDTETRETVAGFMARHGITMSAKLLGIGPDYAGDVEAWDDAHATHWKVTLLRRLSDNQNAKLSTDYHMGSAHYRWKLNAPPRHEAGQYTIKPGERCELIGGRSLTLFQEEAVNRYTEPMPPDPADVLDSLRMDAEGTENARTFEEWASEYGYDTDSRKAERTYRACQEQAGKLARFLGGAYRELFETEPE